MENCYTIIGCRGGLGRCADCDGAKTIRDIARNPNEAQTLANTSKNRGCACLGELNYAISDVRQSNTGPEEIV